jgi:Fe2+ transport system protein FeoA
MTKSEMMMDPDPTLPNSAQTKQLNQLQPGQTGKIVRVGGRGVIRRRLSEMGLVCGETIAVMRVAPLGDPIEFMIKGYHLALRRQDAANIVVETGHNWEADDAG